jgi:hypothetical protein
MTAHLVRQVTSYADNIAKVCGFGGRGRGGEGRGEYETLETAKVQEAQAGVRRPRTAESCLPSLGAGTAEKQTVG